jgi:hypothetical protein
VVPEHWRLQIADCGEPFAVRLPHQSLDRRHVNQYRIAVGAVFGSGE